MGKLGRIAASRVWPFILFLLVIAAGFRIALPYILLNHINKKLSTMEDYQGHVRDIRVNLWRGAYDIDHLKLEKKTRKVPVPFLDVDSIDLSLQWSEIIHGAVVGSVTFYNPNLNFVKGPTRESSQTSMSRSWIDLTESLFPFKLNKVEIEDGTIHYRDFHSDPKVDIHLDRVFMYATNLTNSRSVSEQKFARIKIYNKPEKDDPSLVVDVDLNSFAEAPTFDMKFSLKKLNLIRLNDFLRAYGKFNVDRGTFELYSEISVKDGAYKGYVKPFFQDIHVAKRKKDMTNPFLLAWKALVGAAAKLLENEPTGKIATKVPIEGNFSDKDIDYFAAIMNLLRNAFIRAIKPGFDKSFNGEE